MATKALSFISIPVYTRLLTVEDYGVVNVFMSFVGIVAVLLTLSSEVSIGRYYYDAKSEEDFKRFVGTSLRLTGIILGVMTLLFIVGLNIIAKVIGMPPRLTLCLVPVALFNITNSVFTQIYNPQLQSKKIAIVSSVQCYLAFILSVVCIILIKDEKYYGYIYGNIIAMVLLGAYMVKQIKPYYANCFDKSYIPYILKYCLPHIPDTLSGLVLAQFSKIFMGNNQGYSLAGSYSLVVNIAVLMAVVIQITNNSWVPYYYRYMNAKDYKSINNDFNLIWRLTLIAAIGLSLFGSEIAELLAKNDFWGQLQLLPLLVTGYVFHQWAYVYLRNVEYSRRMMWNTYAYMFSGTVLVILNVLLVPRFHGFGAAIATLISYVALFLFAYVTNRHVIKLYTPSFLHSLKPFLLYSVFIAVAIFVYTLNMQKGVLLLFKAVLFALAGMIMIYPYKDKIISYIVSRRAR